MSTVFTSTFGIQLVVALGSESELIFHTASCSCRSHGVPRENLNRLVTGSRLYHSLLLDSVFGVSSLAFC